MQQPLERYGVVVLLFLVALVAVAVFWEDGSSTRKIEEALAEVTPVRETPPEPPVKARPVQPTGGAEAGPSAESGRAQRRPALGNDEPTGVDQRGSTYTYEVPPEKPAESLVHVVPTSQPEDRHGFSEHTPRGGQQAPGGTLGNVPDAPGVRDPLFDGLKGGAGPANIPAAQPPVKSNPAPNSGAATPPRVEPPAQAREVVVREGDSLWRIAARELGDGKRWQEIAKLNGIADGDVVQAGARLRLPTASNEAAKQEPKQDPKLAPAPPPQAKPAPKASPAPAADQRTYIVRAGDSLGRIAQRELGSAKRVDELRALNRLSGDVIRVGEMLTLPGGAALAPAPAPSREAVANAAPRPAPARSTPPRRVPADGEFVVR